ncbi:MAG TPA: CocE/NonD family hydrolase [Candidatus Limnocylindria bacterium]
MRTDEVAFFSDGVRLSGYLHRPDASPGALPFIVQGPGWMGLADAKLYGPYHHAFTDAGFAVLIFDYRGFGRSDGDRGTLSPAWQLADWRSAIAYMRGRDDVDAGRGAIFGSGGTGGGNAVLVAAAEPDMRATISQVPIADGRDWLHRQRAEPEWLAFLESVETDRRARATTGKGTDVHPRQGIALDPPERKTTTVKSDVDARIPTSVPLAAAQGILDYRPIDAAPHVRGLMVIAVAEDAMTPTDHAERLFEAAPVPKRLIMQRNTTHYAAYQQYGPQVIPLMVEWLERLVLRDGDVEVRTGEEEAIVTNVGGGGS